MLINKQLESRVREAFDFYTGGQFTPHLQNPSWQGLIIWLRKNDIDPFEFCYFCITELDLSKPVNLTVLQRKYYICSQPVLDHFLKWRPLRSVKFEAIVKLHTQLANNLLNIYPNWNSLLLDKSVLIAEYVRLELTLEHVTDENVKERIFGKWMTNMMLVWKGVPELESLCPNLSKALKGNQA